eukprot:7044506-Prymnesium_polylepis.1
MSALGSEGVWCQRLGWDPKQHDLRGSAPPSSERLCSRNMCGERTARAPPPAGFLRLAGCSVLI